MGRQNRSAASDPLRDPRVAGFAKDGEWDGRRPSAAAAAVLEEVSRPEWRCSGASRDEMLGMLRQAAALESWAAAVNLGVLRSLVRDDDEPLSGGGYHGDLPEGWTKSLTHEVALALAVPVVSADKMMWAAWDMQARLPGIGALLADGELTYAKAKVVHEVFLLLSDEHAAQAEALILPELPGKTYGQVKRLAEQAALTVDPEAAARRRAHAERENARVTLFREDSGAVGLSGRDLPTDQALAAHAHVCARAQQYKDSGAFPGYTGVDQFRAAAYLDLLNGRPAKTRIASGQLAPVAQAAKADTPGNAEAADDTGDGAVPTTGTAESAADTRKMATDDCDAHGLGGDGLGDGGPDDHPNGGQPGAPGRGGGSLNVAPPRLADLVLPLATLLGLAERPGETHSLGPLDPDLCRELAMAAIGSPWTRLCITVTDAHGVAIGHGCAKPTRNAKATPPGPAGQPTRLRPNISAGPVCLSSSVQSASRAGLAGARSRACHQVKQSNGWKVTQPRPGWHQWETPSGRTYTQLPKRYPT